MLSVLSKRRGELMVVVIHAPPFPNTHTYSHEHFILDNSFDAIVFFSIVVFVVDSIGRRCDRRGDERRF
jgi:hypothetical protein